jgi:hypothetical protein
MPRGNSERRTGALRVAAAPIQTRREEVFAGLFQTIFAGLQANILQDALGIFEQVCTRDGWRAPRERKIRSALESYLKSPEEGQFRRLQAQVMVYGIEAWLHAPEGREQD